MVGFAALWVALSLLTWQSTVLEPDLLKALRDQDPVQDQLFTAYQRHDPFVQKIFITSAAPLRPEISEKLAQFGYRQDGMSPPDEQPLWWYLGLLADGQLEHLLSLAALENAAESAANAMTKPGGGLALAALEADPFRIKQAALTRLNSRILGQWQRDGRSAEPESQVVTFSRQGSEAKETTATELVPLYEYLKAQPGITALASEFFTIENTLAIKRDMQWGFTLATLANIALFLWLCPNAVLLLFLVVGTSFSYLVGLCLLNISFPYVFTLTLAFTSTFASFNNEYLVHLSGIAGDRWKVMGRGLISAIGTTLIIFILLAFSSSPLIQQVALISIGGMVGFIGLLLGFTKTLGRVRYRQIPLPALTIPRKAQRWLCIALWLIAAVIVGRLTTQTDISQFRYESPYLAESRSLFETLRANAFAKVPVALPVPASDEGRHVLSDSHPLHLVTDRQSLSWRMGAFARNQAEALSQLDGLLRDAGLRLQLSAVIDPAAIPAQLNSASLTRISAVSPFPFSVEASTGTSYAIDYVPPDTASALIARNTEARRLSPKIHYDNILTDASLDMMRLFGLGFGVILLFLWLLQKPKENVFYILTPLALALIAVSASLWHEGRAVNFIHLLGFSLVLAVALDYATIAVASGFSPTEQSKILFTGLSTTITFAILILAHHPVLVDLGTTVAVGSCAALTYALFIRVPPHDAS